MISLDKLNLQLYSRATSFNGFYSKLFVGVCNCIKPGYYYLPEIVESTVVHAEFKLIILNRKVH